jgi:pimeloyl-ACP methyl ester carboxylesterase
MRLADAPAPPEPGERVPLAHTVHGGGPGAPVVLVTGTGYPGRTWPPDLVDPLADGRPVITFDHRGTGETPGTTGPYSTRLFAADLAALLDDLGLGAAHVVGHSMGGRVAQWLVLDRPDTVRTLILAASGPGQFSSAHRQTAGIPIGTALGLAEKGYETYMRDLITTSFFTPELAAADPAGVDWLVRAFWDGRPQLEDYLKHVAARQEHRTTERLSEIAAPTLVVIGDQDTHVGGTGSHWDQSQFLASAIDGAELRVIHGAKHGYFWSHSAEVAELIGSWCVRHDPASARA